MAEGIINNSNIFTLTSYTVSGVKFYVYENDSCIIINADGTPTATGLYTVVDLSSKVLPIYNIAIALTNFACDQVRGSLYNQNKIVYADLKTTSYVIGTLVIPKHK